MSYESNSDETSQTFSLEIPELSSAESSPVSSRTGILSPSSSKSSSITSLNGKPNVKFAPLPELTPRKRRYTAPLGVAARSQMVLQRRQMRGMDMNTYHSHPVWTEEELERQRELAMQEGRRRQNQHHFVFEDDAEDPFLAFGKMVKDAGKTILRKVSIKDLSRKDRKDMVVKVNEHETGMDEALTSKEGSRPRMIDDEQLFQTIGQTDTIREGDANYIWSSEDLEDPSGRTPTQSKLVDSTIDWSLARPTGEERWQKCRKRVNYGLPQQNTSLIPISQTGATQTVQVPLTITSTITSVDLVTLFGTSCTTINSAVNSPTPIAQPTQDQPPTTIPTSTPIFTPSAISTQPSSTQSYISTTVQTVNSGTSSSQTPSTIATDNQNKGNPDVAPIVGGTIGGFFGLIAIVVLIWFILRRRQRWDDIFEKGEDEIIVGGARGTHRPARFSLDIDPEPKPYQYGLVGRAVAPSAASPPHSPPMRPSPGAPDLNQARTSLMPLNPVAASTLTLSSMPSTGSSQSPLYPPQQGFATKGYQHGYAPPLPKKQSVDWGTATNTSPPHMTHSHSASTGSFISPPVSHAHWTGDVGPGYNGGVATTMTMGMNTPVMTPDEVMLLNRSGSPTSIQETRRLQVTNANPDEFEFGESSTSAAAAAAAAAAMSVKNKKLRDGKGRLVTRSTGPPIVHVDGGRVVANVEPAASGPQPPAYTD
ncbi:hypothetical protein C0993_005907 [Termitomyces sp. T159_Od127]|nr:hypothetical protein C0993_005907 [Termitomyces sp. T159_Od127]